MLLYGWNSIPITLANIHCSLIVREREFTFPIDFSTTVAVCITVHKKWIESFIAKQALLLKYDRKITKILISKHCVYHHDWINHLRPDPREYQVGDIFLAQRQEKPNKAKGHIDKIE